MNDADDDHYDRVENIFPQKRDAVVLQQTTNPNHDADVDEDSSILKTNNPYYNGDKEFHGSAEMVVKALENPYYDSDPDLQPGSQTIQTSNNPYYGVEVNAVITDLNVNEEDNEKNMMHSTDKTIISKDD